MLAPGKNPKDLSGSGLAAWVASQLQIASIAWAIGIWGAVAEFLRAEDEACETDEATFVATARGAIRVAATDATRARTIPDATHPSVALCLQAPDCGMHGRNVITEVGRDREAVRACDRESILFDLGLGSPYFDFCIRTADPSAVENLRRYIGKSLFDARHGPISDIVAMNPHRVFVSRLGRIEVYQRIAGPEEATPDGPHTHLLPELLRTRRVCADDASIPAGWIPCVTLYPGHAPAHADKETRLQH